MAALHLITRMNWLTLFRIITLLIFIYICFLTVFHFNVGMFPIWCCLLIGSFLLSFHSVHQWFFGNLWLKTLIIVGLSIFFIIETLIFYTGHKTSISSESDYIIVLGASVKGETMSLTLHNRVEKAYNYLLLHPNTKAILSGGQGPGENITEALAMKQYLTKKGITENRLILEEASTSTIENIKFSYAFVEDQKTVTIITSSFHILRSRLIAHQQGKSTKGIGSATIIYLAPNYYLREFFGVLYQFFVPSSSSSTTT